MKVLLLTGTCGAGKSTVAQLLADRQGWARVSEDDVWHSRFHRHRGSPGSVEHRRKRALVRAEVMAAVRRAVLAGSDVVELWRKFTRQRFPPEVFLDTSADTPEQSAARVLASVGGPA